MHCECESGRWSEPPADIRLWPRTCRRGFLYKLTLKKSSKGVVFIRLCFACTGPRLFGAEGRGPWGLSTHCPCQRYGAWNAAGGPSAASALLGPLLSRRVWDLSRRPQGRGRTMEVMQPSSGTQNAADILKPPAGMSIQAQMMPTQRGLRVSL